MTYLEKVDRYYDSLKIGKSAIVDTWFLMSGPMPVIGLVTSYLVFISIGPKLMRNRPPLKMYKIMTYYNAIQVLLSIMICAKALRLNLFNDGVLYAGCVYHWNSQNYKLLDLGWWYFFAKVTELLDTVFFILRKKNKQVTFLHVYHHASMALYAWSYLKFAAAGQGVILALLNSLVHVVMYSYYFLSGLGPQFQKYLWWKKYVTSMQLIQFVIMLSYNVWTHNSPKCQYSAGFTYYISTNVCVYLLLFLNFYIKNYNKKTTDSVKVVCDKTESENSDGGGGQRNGAVPKTALDDAEPAQRNGQQRNGAVRKTALDDDIEPLAVNGACGDYSKNGKAFLTRRTAKAFKQDFARKSQ